MLAAIEPISAISAGLSLGAIGALYALHHLRTQGKRKAVATLIFWQGASPIRTRVPWSRRFRHPWTFVLLAAIAVAAAAALTADRWKRGLARATDRDIVVIDTGSATAATDLAGRSQLRAETDLVSADLDRLSAQPALITAGPIPMLLSSGDLPTTVTRRQVQALLPQSGASNAFSALQLAACVQGQSSGRILWYTSEPRLPDGLPPGIAARVILRKVTPGLSAAIVGMTFATDDADPTRGSLHVCVAGNTTAPWTVEARFGPNTTSRLITPIDGRGEAKFDNVLADGSYVNTRLLQSDSMASIQLPDRRPLTFRFLGSVPDALRAALLTQGNAADDGTFVVAQSGTPLPPGARAAILIEPAATTAASPLTLVDSSTEPLQLENARVHAIPTGSMNGVPLLRAGDTTLVSLDLKPTARTLHVSQSVISDDAELPRRAAFPVLVAKWCDQLAGRPPGSAVLPLQRVANDPLWTPSEANGRVATVADLPPTIGTLVPSPLPFGSSGDQVPWTTIVLGVALALLLLEGGLFAKRKIV